MIPANEQEFHPLQVSNELEGARCTIKCDVCGATHKDSWFKKLVSRPSWMMLPIYENTKTSLAGYPPLCQVCQQWFRDALNQYIYKKYGGK